jgi:hypothetical protein
MRTRTQEQQEETSPSYRRAKTLSAETAVIEKSGSEFKKN